MSALTLILILLLPNSWVRLSAPDHTHTHTHECYSWKSQARTHECECLSGSLQKFFRRSAAAFYPSYSYSWVWVPPLCLHSARPSRPNAISHDTLISASAWTSGSARLAASLLSNNDCFRIPTIFWPGFYDIRPITIIVRIPSPQNFFV